MQLVIKQLKDGTGRVCIHWFRRCDDGPIQTATDVRMSVLGPIKIGGVKGMIACHPDQNTVSSQLEGQTARLCCNSDDIRAVTCEACLATQEAKEMLKHYADMLSEKA